MNGSTPFKKAIALTVLFLFLGLSSLVYGQTVNINLLYSIRPSRVWGVSICWWGNQIGGWSEQKEKCAHRVCRKPGHRSRLQRLPF